MSALPLCQQYSLLAEQTVLPVFLGWTLLGTDVPQLLHPTVNSEDIRNSHLEISVSHRLSQQFWGLFQELKAHSIQTPTAINIQLLTLHSPGAGQRKAEGCTASLRRASQVAAQSCLGRP